MVERLFLAVPRGCLRFVIVVFPDHTHLLFFKPTMFPGHVHFSPQEDDCYLGYSYVQTKLHLGPVKQK